MTEPIERYETQVLNQLPMFEANSESSDSACGHADCILLHPHDNQPAILRGGYELLVDQLKRDDEVLSRMYNGESVESKLAKLETMAYATGQQVDWLVNQLVGMFNMAANMPGLGGMMVRKMTGSEK